VLTTIHEHLALTSQAGGTLVIGRDKVWRAAFALNSFWIASYNGIQLLGFALFILFQRRLWLSRPFEDPQ
jgi:hypothetical protein